MRLEGLRPPQWQSARPQLQPAQLDAAGLLSSSRQGTASGFSLPLLAAKRSAPRCKPHHPAPPDPFRKISYPYSQPGRGCLTVRDTRSLFNTQTSHLPALGLERHTGGRVLFAICPSAFKLVIEAQVLPRRNHAQGRLGSRPEPPAPDFLPQPGNSPRVGIQGWLLWDGETSCRHAGLWLTRRWLPFDGVQRQASVNSAVLPAA